MVWARAMEESKRIQRLVNPVTKKLAIRIWYHVTRGGHRYRRDPPCGLGHQKTLSYTGAFRRSGRGMMRVRKRGRIIRVKRLLHPNSPGRIIRVSSSRDKGRDCDRESEPHSHDHTPYLYFDWRRHRWPQYSQPDYKVFRPHPRWIVGV